MVDSSASIWAPVGDPGPPGPQGPTGPTGPIGPIGGPGPDAAMFAQFLVDLANQLVSTKGAHLVGYSGDFLNNWLDKFKMPITNIIYSDSPQFTGLTLQQIVDTVPSNSKLIIRGTYTTTTTVLVDTKNDIELEFFPGSSLTGVAPWVFKPGYRGVLSYNACNRPVTRYPNIRGLRVGPRGVDIDDGDAGIEYINCASPKTLWGIVNHVLTWGVIHVGCTNQLVEGMSGSEFTMQSAVGNASCTGGIVRFCTFEDGGLYGIECEGPINESTQVYNNKVTNFLQGYTMVQSNKRSVIANNIAENCSQGLAVNMTSYPAAAGIDVCNNIFNSCLIDVSLIAARFTTVSNNSGLPYVANGYYHVSAQDWACNIISTTAINVRVSGLAAFVPGDIHSYNGALKTVLTVAGVTDPVYGACTRITYNAPHGLTFGAAFGRSTPVSSIHTFMQLGTSSEHVQVFNNRCNNAKTYLKVLGGVHNAFNFTDNFGSDGTGPIIEVDPSATFTNSLIMIREGQMINNAGVLISGTTPVPAVAIVHGDRINIGLAYNKKNSIFTPVNTTCVRVRLSIINPNVPTGTTLLTLNGVTIASIPPGSFVAGTTMIQDIIQNTPASTYEFKIADTIGNLTFDSCNVEITVVYK